MMTNRMLRAMLLASTSLLPQAVLAEGPLPSDPRIVSGDITITNPDAINLLIQQGGKYGVIDWGSFSIDAGHGVSFQNGTGATLNRVTGGDLSVIQGRLDATGTVYLINRNGIVVGRDGVVGVGGTFVASTLDISNGDFLSGGDETFKGDSTAMVVNLGRISALGGDVAILAQDVVNEGKITAPKGTVGLAAGREILMRDAAVADGMFAVKLGGSGTSVTEAGTIAAAAAELRANGGNVYALAGNTGGAIAATGVEKVGGRVFLTAGDSGKVTVDKQVRAKDGDGTGGKIVVDGGRVVMSGLLDASGRDGGEVRITSSIDTNFSGEILTFGNDFESDGGFVEVSGAHLTFDGHVDTGGGLVLIDPDNIEITDNNAVILNGASVMSTAAMISLLETGDLIISTDGSDTEAGTILISWDMIYDSAFDLTLLAHGDIVAWNSIQNAGTGDLNLVAGWNGSTGLGGFTTGAFGGALASQTVFGNNSGVSYSLFESSTDASGSILIGDGNTFLPVALGTRGGATRAYANDLRLEGGSTGDSSYATVMLGYNANDPVDGLAITGNILVRATGDITLLGGNTNQAAAQIGHVGLNPEETSVSVSASGDIDIEALGDLTLWAGDSADGAGYAMIGHGSVSAFTGALQGNRSGDITVDVGGEVTLQDASTGDEAWIGHSSLTNDAVSGDIFLRAAAFDRNSDTTVGSGGEGELDLRRLASNLLDGNVTIEATDSSLRLIGTTGGIDCECESIDSDFDLVVQASDDIVLDADFFYANRGTGNLALAAGANFHNEAGDGAFGDVAGRWLIYSTRPDQNTDDLYMLGADFLRYNRTFNAANPFGMTPAGNGLIYSVQPVITVGNATMTYGGSLVLPDVTVTVDGQDVDATEFGLVLSAASVSSSVVTLSSTENYNAGTWANALVASATPEAGIPQVLGLGLDAGQLVVDRARLTVSLTGTITKPYDGTTLARLLASNFLLSGFVEGEGASVTETRGQYASAEVGSEIGVSANLTAGDFDADAGTDLDNYILPTRALGSGEITEGVVTEEVFPEIPSFPSFATTPLGEPSGPAGGLEVIDGETTQRILDEIRAGAAFCKALVREEYVIDCLSDRLQSVADGLSAVGEYSEVRSALEDAADRLHSLVLANASQELAQQVMRAGGQRSSRPLTAVSTEALGAANAQAAQILEETGLVLLRSSSGSAARQEAFSQVAQVVNSTKVLLRSS